MTDKNDLGRITAFALELDRLKTVLRKTRPPGLDRLENSAEHSWQVSLLALLLANHAPAPLDRLRLLELLLVHDIAEIDAGDRIVYQAVDAAAVESEQQAARRIFGLLPEAQSSTCLARWQEYETRESAEARFAYAIDHLMSVLHNLHNGGQSWRENQVPLARILSVNKVIGEVLPELWRELQPQIEHMAAICGLTRE